MSTTPMTESTNTAPTQTVGPVASGAPLLICLPSINAEGLETMRGRIAATLPGHTLFIASPGAGAPTSNGVTMVDYPQPSPGDGGWALTATDYLGAAQLAAEYDAAVTFVLGTEAVSLSSAGLQALAESVLNDKADLALPRYQTGPHDALLSSALLYPVTNALFGVPAHLPLALDVAFSARMAKRLTTVARKPNNASQADPLIWPVAEASIASFTVKEIDAGTRTLPQPAETDLNALLAEIVGSLFSDIEAKATFWQRARAPMPVKPSQEPKRTASEARITSPPARVSSGTG